MTAVHSADLELLERLGGSGATVHRAVVRTTGRVVVVKHAGWDRPDVADRLGREASVLRRVQHPSLVRLLDAVDDDAGRSLVLAHAPGGSLASRLPRLGPLSPADVADLGARLARALTALHGAGVIHRDVHPGNVLVDVELQPVLADLDNALDTTGTHLPGDDEVVGSAAHVDPRLFTSATAGPQSDLHGLATTLWTAATGAPPPRAAPESPVELPQDVRVPAPLRAVLGPCLDGSAQDAATVASRLEGVAVTLLRTPRESPTAPSVPLQPQPPPYPTEALPPTAPPEDRPTSVPTPSPTLGGPASGRRPALHAGGRGGAGDPTTRRWGPAPQPRPVIAAVARPSRRLLVAAGVLAVPLAVLGWSALPGPDITAATAAAPAIAVPPTPCDEPTAQEPSPGATGSGGQPVLADLDGDGCSEVVRLVDGELHTPDGRYRVGQPRDVLVTGDWDGDGHWGVGLYRPRTGVVYLIDEPGPGARSRPAEQHAANGRPRVVVTPGGTHRVEVTVDAES